MRSRWLDIGEGLFACFHLYQSYKSHLNWFIFSLEETLAYTLSKTFPQSRCPVRPKCSKSIPVFRPKRLKNHTLWGGTYLYTLYRGVPLSPGLKRYCISFSQLQFRPQGSKHVLELILAAISLGMFVPRINSKVQETLSQPLRIVSFIYSIMGFIDCVRSGKQNLVIAV